MKKIILGIISSFLIFASCSKDDSDCSVTQPEAVPAPALITPRIDVRMADPLNQSAFTGVLEVYPCTGESSIYYGNYVNGKLSVFNGYYTIVNGVVSGEYNRELHLPTGDYNMVYWGTPQYQDQIDTDPQIVSPGLIQGADLSKLYFSLKSIGNNLYSPVFDLVYAVKSAHIGTDALQAALTRISAGLKLNVKQTDGSPFISEIASFKVNIGNIAEKINFYTAEVVNMTKTVQFELERSSDGMTYSNPTVMLFPSAANPPLELLITLEDGTEYNLTQNLNSTLSSNTMLTLNINVGTILADGNPGDFTLDDWNESSETIDFPTVN